MPYRNGNFARAASKITYLGRLYNKNKPKHRQRQAKEFWQTSTSKHQLQANQDKEKPVTKCRHLTVGNTPGVPFSGYCHDFLLNDKLGWQAINIIQVKLTSQNLQVMHKSALVGKNTPMTQVHTHDSSSTGQRLKSLAIHGIAESE